MAEVNRVDLNFGHKIANPFKTTRKSDTNPFKYSNFEGNTLQFADVFEGYDQEKDKSISFKGHGLNAADKMKMISSSVIGSITKMHKSITEPIVNFVNRIRYGISEAWSYAKNTNIEIPGMKNISEHINGIKNSNICKGISNVLNYDVGKGISDSISTIKNSLNKDVTEVGHELSDKWSALISKIHRNKISSDMSVSQLKELWLKENSMINNISEVKVA